MSRKYQFKQEQKELAKTIREKKNLRKKVKDGYVEGLPYLRYQYRHKHIAYCLLRGTPYEKIEQPHPNNKPRMKYVREIMDEFKEKEAA